MLLGESAACVGQPGRIAPGNNRQIPCGGGDTISIDAKESRWSSLIQKIQCNDAAGLEELYRVFCRGVRFHLWRRVRPEDLDDTVHDTFLIVAQAIRRGDLREPDRLMGFVWTVVRRQLAAYIERSANSRRHLADIDGALRLLDPCPNPEWSAITLQRQRLARCVLHEVAARDREILVRFYLNEQRPEQICREMGLTQTQFRLLKSRAKERFGVLGQQTLARRRICW